MRAPQSFRANVRWALFPAFAMFLLVAIWAWNRPLLPEQRTAVFLLSDLLHEPSDTFLQHPLYGLMLRGIHGWTPSVYTFASLLQLLLGLLLLGCIWRLLVELFVRIPPVPPAPPSLLNASMGMGLLSFGLLPPVQQAVLHPGPVLLEAVLILTAILCLPPAWRGQRKALIFGSVVAGLATLETGLAWMVLPLLAATGLRCGRVHAVHRVLLPVWVFLLPAATGRFLLYLGFYPDAGMVNWLRLSGGTQIRALRMEFFYPGWILVLGASCLPGILAFSILRFRIRRRGYAGTLLLLGLLMAVHIALLFPLPLASHHPERSQVFPWVMTAAFTAYALLMLHQALYSLKKAGWRKPLLVGVWGGTALAVYVGAQAAQLIIRSPETGVMYRLAKTQSKRWPTSPIVLSHGLLDPWLKLAAVETNRDLLLIQPRTLHQPSVRNLLTSRLPELRSGRAARWTALDAAAWFKQHPELRPRLRLLDEPNPIMAAGWAAMPDLLGYEGVTNLQISAVRDAFDHARQGWSQQVADPLRILQKKDPPMNTYGRILLAAGSRQFNQFGILFEELDQPALAGEAYAMAVELLPRNISAALNQAGLADTPLKLSSVRDILTAAGIPPERLRFQNVIAQYGHIRRTGTLVALIQVSALDRDQPETDTSPSRAEILFSTAQNLYRRGFPEAAQALFAESNRLSPTPTARNNLAWLALQRGDVDRAELWAQQSLELWPANPAALDTLGQLRLLQNRYTEARDLFQRAAELAPGNPVYREHLLKAERHALTATQN